MPDDFNFDITTKYDHEFKSQATPDQLLNQLAQERMKNERRKIIYGKNYNSLIDEVPKMLEIVYGNDKSSIKNKLNRQLHLDIKVYAAKSDEENFNVLKLLRFIVKTNRYEKQYNDIFLKTVSVINLIAKPSLDHTDAAHSVYEEHFRSIVEEIRPAVNDADNREETIDWIHDLWQMIHTTLDLTTLEDRQIQQNALQTINQRIKYILDCLDKNKIAQLQRPNESIIDTFYNILLSSRIIAEIEDMKTVVYTYQKEEVVPQEITNLFMDNIFSKPVTWKDFQTMINIKKADLTDRTIQMIWSLLLCKENVTIEDLRNINQKDYNFAGDYTETIAEYWIKDILHHDRINLGEWIIVMQELMCIHHDKIKYKNSYIRRTNTSATLTAAIKNFEEKSQLPHLIVLKRLTHRLLLIYGAKDLLEQKLQADKYIMELEKIIFSYKNIEDIRTAHNLLYFQVISVIATDMSCLDIPNAINLIMQDQLKERNLPLCTFAPESILYAPQYEFLIHILAQDKYFRLKDDAQFKAFGKDALYALEGGIEEYLKFVMKHPAISYPEFVYEILANLFVEEIKKLNHDKSDVVQSQPLSVTIYFGEKNLYNLFVTFNLVRPYNCIFIKQIDFLGIDVDSPDRYKELLLL